MYVFLIFLIQMNSVYVIGAQGRPPHNVPQWHIDYFELKLRTGQHERVTVILLLVSLKAGNKSLT